MANVLLGKIEICQKEEFVPTGKVLRMRPVPDTYVLPGGAECGYSDLVIMARRLGVELRVGAR